MKRSYLSGGVFLLSGEKMKWPGCPVFVSAVAAWFLSAFVLLTAAALTANLTGMGEQGIGILSSALSFLCAAASGWAAAKKQRANRLLTALITSTMLVVLLLTVGFLIRGTELNPSSILSLVSFTYAGVLFGALILYGPKTAGKKSPHFVRKLT